MTDNMHQVKRRTNPSSSSPQHRRSPNDSSVGSTLEIPYSTSPGSSGSHDPATDTLLSPLSSSESRGIPQPSRKDHVIVKINGKHIIGCSIVTLIIGSLFYHWLMYHAHNLTCQYHKGMCTPLWHFVSNEFEEYADTDGTLRYRNVLLTDKSGNADTHQMLHNLGETQCHKSDLHNLGTDITCLSPFGNDPESGKRGLELTILLGPQFGGSMEYIGSILDRHSKIDLNIELYRAFQQWQIDNKCVSYYGDTSSAANSECNDATILITKIAHMFKQSFAANPNYCTDAADKSNSVPTSNVILIGVNVDMFIGKSDAFLDTFTRFVYCNHISVIHYHHSATIEQYIAFKRASSSVAVNSAASINAIVPKSDTPINHELARQFVDTLDEIHSRLRIKLKFYPFTVKNQDFYHENFLTQYRPIYVETMIAFLGLAPETKSMLGKFNIKWPMAPCFRTINEWEHIKSSFEGTDTYYACETAYA